MSEPRLYMDDAEICVRYRQAADKRHQAAILAQLNACPRERIVNILKAGGVWDPPSMNREWTAADEKQLLELTEAGLSHTQAAVKMGRTPAAIIARLRKLRRLQEAGKDPLPPGMARDKEERLIMEIVEGKQVEGLSRAELMELLYHAIGEELQAGPDARLVDMLAALGFAVLKKVQESQGDHA